MITLSNNQAEAMLTLLELINTQDMHTAGMNERQIALVEDSYLDIKKQVKDHDSAA